MAAARIVDWGGKPFPITDEKRIQRGFRASYQSWALTVSGFVYMVCEPVTTDEVVDVANWAAANMMRVRVIGQKHNWSPLTIAPKDAAATKDVILMHLGKLQGGVEVNEQDPHANGRPTVSVNLGISQREFLGALEEPKRTAGMFTAFGQYCINPRMLRAPR